MIKRRGENPRPLKLVDRFQGKSDGATILEVSPQTFTSTILVLLGTFIGRFEIQDYMITETNGQS